MKEIKREEQKLENTWDLSKIYQTEEAFNEDIKTVENLICNYSKYQGHIADSANHLYEVLELDTQVSRLLEKLATYAYRKLDEDITNTNSQTLRGRIDNLYTKVGSASAFIVPEILKEDFEKIKFFIDEKEELKEYKLLLERIFRLKEHTLSEKEEIIICELSNVLNSSNKIAGIIRNSEIPLGTIQNQEGKEIALTNENYQTFIKDEDRKVRKDAFETLYHAYANFKDTFTETIGGEATKNVKLSMLKKYSSAKNASLYQNRVTEDVYNNLITVVNKNLSVLYKYFRLKKEQSGLKDYCLYDTYLNLVKGNNKKYTFEEAKRIILDVLKVFGEDYLSHIKKAFDERWIDIYPNKGKRGGAYSFGSYDTPAYILLNYQEDYHDLSTVIHELGHSMHTVYSIKNNKPQYSNYKIFVAEVASTVNEMLLNYYMLENSNSREEKQYIISEMLDNFKATLFRQTMFSEFEEFVHEKIEQETVLTSDLLCQKYYELNQKYFGDEVIVNDEIRYEWERIPHFYYNFYVYQYATGLSSACYIVNRIRNKEKGAVEDYLKFLSSGDSLDPIDELKLAGVDITKKEVIQSAIDMFDKLIDEYQNLINE